MYLCTAKRRQNWVKRRTEGQFALTIVRKDPSHANGGHIRKGRNGMDGHDPAQTKFQFYEAPASTVRSLRTMTIGEVYCFITLDSRTLDMTRKLRAIGDVKERKQFKAANFCFACFSGIFSYRKDECLVSHSGLICIDFDGRRSEMGG